MSTPIGAQHSGGSHWTSAPEPLPEEVDERRGDEPEAYRVRYLLVTGRVELNSHYRSLLPVIITNIHMFRRPQKSVYSWLTVIS